jgi:hypothetical protein
MPLAVTASATRRPVLLVAAVLALLLTGCADDDGDEGATSADTAAVSTTSTTAASTTTAPEPARAFVTAPTVQPIVTPTTDDDTDGVVPLDELVVGDCVDLPGLGLPEAVEVTTATRVPCDEPHGVEVFAVASLNDDPAAGYPGDDVVVSAADDLCLAAFPAYVGTAYVDSSLEIVHLRPDAAVWGRGDRIVRCAVHDRALEPLVGSVAGSAR